MDKAIFVQNVKKYCERKGVKPTVACRESGVGRSFINNIEHHGQIPSVEKVQMLAAYLGVSTSVLLGEREEALYEAFFDTMPQETLDDLFEAVDTGAQLMVNNLKNHIEHSPVSHDEIHQEGAPFIAKLSAKVYQIAENPSIPNSAFIENDEEKYLSPADRKLLNTIVDALIDLNEEGQEKLMDYAADLVASGRYIKSHLPGSGRKEA